MLTFFTRMPLRWTAGWVVALTFGAVACSDERPEATSPSGPGVQLVQDPQSLSDQSLSDFVSLLNASGGSRDFAVGGGQHDDLLGVCSNSDGTCVNVGFAAHSDPAGDNPQGHVSFTQPRTGFELKGPVTCLRVTGNQAVMVFIQTKESFPGAIEGEPAALHVVDNGNPVEGESPDLIRGYPNVTGLTNPVTCFVPFLPPVRNVRGNIVVSDALP
jgi:hypothetical protein